MLSRRDNTGSSHDCQLYIGHLEYLSSVSKVRPAQLYDIETVMFIQICSILRVSVPLSKL